VDNTNDNRHTWWRPLLKFENTSDIPWEVRTRAVVPVCKSRMSWRRNGGMPDPRSAFHSATLSTESNADLMSIYATTKEEVNAFAAAAFVCLSVSKITQKHVHGFGWNVACRQMSGHGRTDYLLSPIRIIVRMPEPDCFLSLSLISYALQRWILLRRENLTYRYWAPVAAARRGFKMVLFTASRANTFVGGTCALPSALLVVIKHY